MYKEAVEQYKKAIELNPEYSEAYINLGIVYYYQDRYKEALQPFIKAHELEPEDVSALAYLIELYILMGDFKKADSFASELLNDYELVPVDLIGAQALSVISLMFLGKQNDAIRKLKALIKDINRLPSNYKNTWYYDKLRELLINQKLLNNLQKRLLIQLIDALIKPKSKAIIKLQELVDRF